MKRDKTKRQKYTCIKCNGKWVGGEIDRYGVDMRRYMCPHCKHMVFGWGHHRY